MSDIIKIRRDTFANWQAANPIPALGEITYDMTNSQFRIGNGTSAWLSLSPVGNVPISDGDKGDIVVSSSGTVWTVDSGSINTSKLGGDITTAGKALLDDASSGDQRTTLGLGTMATQSASSVSITGGSISGITEAFSTPLNQAVVKVGRNQTGSLISKGQVVYVSGSQGTHLTIALANNTAESTSSKTIGVAGENIADNSTGFVICTGILGNLDTNLLTEGAAIWLNSSAGGMTTTKPTAPNHTVQIGWCVKQGSGSSGIIYVHIANGHELDELHDVKVTSVANNDLIRWDSATSTWKNFQGSTLFSTVGHGHAISDVTNLQTTLDGKAASSHTHTIGDVTGLASVLATYAPISHTHSLGNLTQSSATSGQFVKFIDASNGWQPATLTIADVTNLQTTLNGKAASSHSHVIGDTTGLQTALDGKAASSHIHAIADTTGLQSALDNKAASAHTHAIADTTGLQSALDNKAASSHTHALTDLQAGSATSTQVVRYNGTNWAPASLLISDITGLAVMLGTFSSIGHGHPLADIQASSASTGQVPRFNGTNWVAATLAIADVSGLQGALDGKAASSHTHALTDLQAGSATSTQVVRYNGTNWAPASLLISDITGLATMLGTFSSIGHTHTLTEIQNGSATSGQVVRSNGSNWVAATLAIADVSGLQGALDGKAASSHTHAIADTTGLQSALDGKASTTHAASHASGGSDAISINASQITAGTVATARLGSGTATHGNVLWGDQTWRNATCRPAVKPLSGSFVIPGVVADAYSTLAGTANCLDLVPVRCIKDTAVNAISCNVTALVASSKVRLAVYESNSDGWPAGTPVLESGALDTGSTGTKSTAVSFTLLGDRQYWLAIWYSSNPTLRAQGVGSFPIIGGGAITGTAVNNKVRITGVTYGDATAFRNFTTNPVTNADLTAGSMPVIALTVV